MRVDACRRAPWPPFFQQWNLASPSSTWPRQQTRCSGAIDAGLQRRQRHHHLEGRARRVLAGDRLVGQRRGASSASSSRHSGAGDAAAERVGVVARRRRPAPGRRRCGRRAGPPRRSPRWARRSPQLALQVAGRWSRLTSWPGSPSARDSSRIGAAGGVDLELRSCRRGRAAPGRRCARRRSCRCGNRAARAADRRSGRLSDGGAT